MLNQWEPNKDLALSEGLEDLDDVSGHPDVDEHLLRKLVPGQLSFREKPPTQNQNDQNDLKRPQD